MRPVDPRIAAQRPTGCCSARLLGCGPRSPLYLIGDAASRRGLSRVGYFNTISGPLDGHPSSIFYLYPLVRPTLEYASAVCDLYTTTQTGSLIISQTNGRMGTLCRCRCARDSRQSSDVSVFVSALFICNKLIFFRVL